MLVVVAPHARFVRTGHGCVQMRVGMRATLSLLDTGVRVLTMVMAATTVAAAVAQEHTLQRLPDQPDKTVRCSGDGTVPLAGYY